eukprot:m.1056744 g.1056744  ORF g.1056744 m.1056744 type:complete len:51 (-) comp24199_c0_seq1:310-462(-)
MVLCGPIVTQSEMSIDVNGGLCTPTATLQYTVKLPCSITLHHTISRRDFS